jgi:uncharacterized protein (TIGR02145 family)
MKKIFIVSICFLLLFSCKSDKKSSIDSYNAQYNHRIDSLKTAISMMKMQLQIDSLKILLSNTNNDKSQFVKTTHFAGYKQIKTKRARANETGNFTDKRDGKVYKWVQIGDKIWMAQNLNFNLRKGACAYNNDTTKRRIYGLLYEFGVLKEACPKGWHVPTEEEWEDLEIAAGMNKNQSRNQNIWRGSVADKFFPGGSTGFNVLFGGIYRHGDFDDLTLCSHFWTSTKTENSVFCRIFRDNIREICKNKVAATSSLSVRCVKDTNAW